ncbi:MAG: transglycosylase SLT domain-containing protein [Paracoccaceae bacterium]|nr:MAG: transglycosylase SLT domain-containing protein [Paracoccaceae bacterium]
MTRRPFLATMLALVLSGCLAAPDAGMMQFRPAMRWDHRDEATDWTARTLMAVAEEDDALAMRVPHDIETWCPGYSSASLPERRAFWVAMLSALAKHESTWNPRASGGGGRWIGLTQIAPSTARLYRCEARTPAALKDGTANLECAVEIMADKVAKDGHVAGPRGTLGLGRDWAPFRKASKRSDMAAWVSQQSYCKAS